MPGPGLGRRRFLALVASAAAGATVVVACGDDDGGGADRTSSTVAPLPTSLAEALATLAAAVRRVAPDLEPLDLPAGATTDPDALAAAVAQLDEATRQDLAAGDTVEVAGWVLSTTEARLCLAVA